MFLPGKSLTCWTMPRQIMVQLFGCQRRQGSGVPNAWPLLRQAAGFQEAMGGGASRALDTQEIPDAASEAERRRCWPLRV